MAPPLRGRLYRSQVIARPTERDHVQLRTIGILYVCDLRDVCDLRGATERAKIPNCWPDGMAPEEHNLNIGVDVRAGAEKLVAILKDDPTAPGVRRMMSVNYTLLPNAFAGGPLRQFLDDILTGERFPAVIRSVDTSLEKTTGLDAREERKAAADVAWRGLTI